jgi:hypothetical protein
LVSSDGLRSERVLHRPRLAAFSEQERLVDDLGEQCRIVDAPGALHKRPIDLVLRAVGVEVDLLVGMLAEVMRGHIAGKDHHRNAIERCVRNTRCSVRQSGPQVCE